jgi:hypothetical protein
MSRHTPLASRPASFSIPFSRCSRYACGLTRQKVTIFQIQNAGNNLLTFLPFVVDLYPHPLSPYPQMHNILVIKQASHYGIMLTEVGERDGIENISCKCYCLDRRFLRNWTSIGNEGI